jgi:transposase
MVLPGAVVSDRFRTCDDRAIAAPRLVMTDRAGRWVTEQVGRLGRTVNEIAVELGCDWHTINDTAIAYGTLVDDPDRIGETTALGLDETLFARVGPWRTQRWSTSVVDVRAGQLLDVVEGATPRPRAPGSPSAARPGATGSRSAPSTCPGAYRKVFDTMLPAALQVADPFHLAKLANSKLDECRRRVQNETLGHRGHKDDPLYRCRRLLTKADERLDDRGRTKLLGLLEAGDPRGEVRIAWHAKEVVREIYTIDDPELAAAFVARLGVDLQGRECPPEVRQLGRTIVRWSAQISAWHTARASNGPTEAANNLIKRIKRIGFGFTRFANYRIRVLLSPASPTGTYSPRSHPTEIRSAPKAAGRELGRRTRGSWSSNPALMSDYDVIIAGCM